jgi:cytochrome P450
MLHKNVFLLLDPADIERVLVTDNSNFIKPAWLRTPSVRRLLGDGLVTSEANAWRMQRRASRPAFESCRMSCYANAISAITCNAIEGWQSGQSVDIHREMARLTMRIVGQLLFMTEDDGSDWIDDAGDAMDTLMRRFTAGRSLFGMVPVPPGVEELRAARRLDAIVDKLISDHASRSRSSASNFEPSDLLSLLKRSVADVADSDKKRMLREQVKTYLTAGHESSAIAVSWAFLLLAKHPVAEKQLQDELRATLDGRPPEYSDLRNLPCTQSIINESLRLYPPLWMTGRQSISDCNIGGVPVPAGSLVMTSQWAVHRRSRYYQHPNDFRPERWQNGEISALPRCAYFPFGAGPRICIGLGFALMESALLLATIAQRFRLQLLDDREEINPWATMTLRPPPGIRMVVESISRGDAETQRDIK